MSHAVLTGPIKGTVTLADGTVVDVRDTVVMVDNAEQAAEVAHLVGQRYEAEGHPDFLPEPDVDFVHTPLPEFTAEGGYEMHPDMAGHLDAMHAANPDLVARVEEQRPAIEAQAAEARAQAELDHAEQLADQVVLREQPDHQEG